VPVFDSADEFIAAIKKDLEPAIAANDGKAPRPIVIGALGRCGKGAVDLFRACGIPEESILKWDMEETKKGGPFTEIVESDIFINCVYLGPHKIPPFVTYDSLAIPSRRLRVICDVSCDPNSENNPIPLYSTWSSFGNPTIEVSEPSKISGPELRIIAIDHLPTLVARESSDEYSGLLLPALLDLDKRNNNEEGVWQRAEAIFKDRVSQLPENMK
jgi:saccharopine dehydrogenase (NAD+, L-lysine-forming)